MTICHWRISCEQGGELVVNKVSIVCALKEPVVLQRSIQNIDKFDDRSVQSSRERA